MTTKKTYILKTITWNMQLDIEVEPSKPLGEPLLEPVLLLHVIFNIFLFLLYLSISRRVCF